MVATSSFQRGGSNGLSGGLRSWGQTLKIPLPPESLRAPHPLFPHWPSPHSLLGPCLRPDTCLLLGRARTAALLLKHSLYLSISLQLYCLDLGHWYLTPDYSTGCLPAPPVATHNLPVYSSHISQGDSLLFKTCHGFPQHLRQNPLMAKRPWRPGAQLPCQPPLISSVLPALLQPRRPVLSSTQQAHACLRAFAHALPQALLPHSRLPSHPPLQPSPKQPPDPTSLLP